MSFDRLAPHYRWMEAVLAGGLLQRCRTRWLAEVPMPRRILLAGEGHGRMLEACASRLPGCRITVLDQSAAMLAEARRRWQAAGGRGAVTFEQADLRYWRHEGAAFDLIVTNFLLDCFNPEHLARVVSNLGAAAAPQAEWLVADFCVPPSGWSRFRARAALSLAYSFFRLTTGISAKRLVSPDAALHGVGFCLRQREHFNHGLLHADRWARRN